MDDNNKDFWKTQNDPALTNVHMHLTKHQNIKP